MAVSGHNGNNETLIGMSNSIGLTIYDDTCKEISITKTNSPIKMLIQRDLPSVPESSFYYVNTSAIKLSPWQLYLDNTFNVTTKNSSIHIELKPLNNAFCGMLKLKLKSRYFNQNK